MKAVSTAKAAQMLGMKRENLQRAIRQGDVTAPKLVTVGSVKVRLWTAKDVERARRKLKKD
jgi:predicted DNA-binding transcriptional regulator AlpA